ncbi:hypothetical protein [Thermaurantimonas aggregans]|uniref:hypothetical protein n=1 Tax=Thermaurantimonas aggregans TaxID=2173829 RepID=UPI0023F0A9BA|nr:hypothetical protein [Thermaurantimonas aggregans]MCX8147834.1 hypothetical protein [Thermaurantimonas aggregans]
MHKVAALVGLLIINAISLFGQKNSVSAYSQYGLGDLQWITNGRSFALGGMTLGQYNPLFFNIDNPATLSALDLTTFDFGLNTAVYNISNQQNPSGLRNYSTNFSHLKFAIPVYKGQTISFGYMPYSFIGYDIRTVEENQDPLPKVLYRFTGSGGFNQAFFAVGSKPVKGLSIGLTLKYLFGDKERLNYVIPDLSNALNTRQKSIVRIDGFVYNAGLTYQLKLAERKELVIAGTFSPTIQVAAEYTDVQYSHSGGDFGNPVDTFSQSGAETTVRYPMQWGGAITYQQYSTSHVIPVFTAGVEVRYINGSELIMPVEGSTWQNSLRYAAGVSMLPRFFFPDLERSTNYFNRLEYRLGGFYETGIVNIQNQNISQLGMTFGLALPLRIRGLAPGEVKYNHINIGVVAGRRGTTSGNLIQEDFLRFHFGVTLNDKWFIKYKYR